MIKDRKGQAGGVITFVLAAGIFSLIYIIFSIFMDKIITFSNSFMSQYHYTQEHINALNLCFHYWYALPIIITLGLIIWMIKNAIRARTGSI